MDERGVNVLIVDDQEVFTNALRLWLDGRDGVHVVGVAHDGPEAIDLALARDADVVLMDIGLPKFDGLEATRRLRAIKPTAKVIALSGQSREDGEAAALEAGAVAYLTKDGVHEVLVDAIWRAVLSSPLL